MQQRLSVQRMQTEAYQTRLWWMEIVRGIVSIVLGLLIPFTLGIFTSVLGGFLVLDGTLDIVQTARGRRETQRRWLNILLGLVSIMLGVLTFVNYNATLVLLVVVISISIILRGIGAIIDARHSQHRYEGLTWIFGIASVLFGLGLLLNTIRSALMHTLPLTLTIVVWFISIYAVIDGIYLLMRGLLLYFRPALFIVRKHAPRSPPVLPADLPATTRRAVVFLRYRGANGLGHVGWAFEWHNGWFNAGSVENPSGKPFVRPREMGFWSMHTLDPVGAMQKQPVGYDEYKVFYVTEPAPKDAWKTLIWVSRQSYSVVRNNCSNAAYDILRAYGAEELADPVEGLVPNDWYGSLPGKSYVIRENPVIPIYLHKLSQRDLATREMMLTIPEHVQGAPPPWRVRGQRAWSELYFTWDKMLKDVRALFVSAGKLVAK